MAVHTWDNEHSDDIVFVLIGNVYRLIGKDYSEKSVLSEVVSIGISKPVYDNDMREGLVAFAEINNDFIREYTGHSY